MGSLLSSNKSLKSSKINSQKLYESRIKELETENTRLKDELKSKDSSKQVGSTLSKERLKQFVEKIIKDEDVNIDYLPDFVERKIYSNIFNLLINLLDETARTAGIDVLGHRIEFKFIAIE
jgi:hypothetical protein